MKYPFLLLLLATALAVGAPVDSDDTGSLNEIVSLAQDRLHDWWMASLGREVWDWAKKAKSTTTTTTSATTTTKAVTITGGAMTDAAETTTMTMTMTVVRTVYYGMNSVDGASGRDTITSLAPAPAPSTSTSSSTRATSERNKSTDDDDDDDDDERQAKIHPRTHGMGGLMSKISEDCVSTDTASGSTADADADANAGVETTVDTTTTTITVVGTIYNMSPGGDSTGDASSASGVTTTGLASASIPVFSPLSFLKPSTTSSPLSSAPSTTTTTSSSASSTYTYIPPPTPPELLHAATLTPGRLLCTPHSLSVPLTSLHLAADTFASTCNASSSPPHLSTRGCQVIADSGDAVVSMCGLSNTVMACGDLAEAVRALESPDACVAGGKVGGHVEFAWGMLVVCSRSAVVVE